MRNGIVRSRKLFSFLSRLEIETTEAPGRQWLPPEHGRVRVSHLRHSGEDAR